MDRKTDGCIVRTRERDEWIDIDRQIDTNIDINVWKNIYIKIN